MGIFKCFIFFNVSLISLHVNIATTLLFAIFIHLRSYINHITASMCHNSSLHQFIINFHLSVHAIDVLQLLATLVALYSVQSVGQNFYASVALRLANSFSFQFLNHFHLSVHSIDELQGEGGQAIL